jgi:uncharacterized protein with HEPN domain
MTATKTVQESLRREIKIAGEALKNLKEKVRYFEQKYNLKTTNFVRSFETGNLGDDEDYFIWYSHAKAINEWRDRERELKRFLNEIKG